MPQMDRPRPVRQRADQPRREVGHVDALDLGEQHVLAAQARTEVLGDDGELQHPRLLGAQQLGDFDLATERAQLERGAVPEQSLEPWPGLGIDGQLQAHCFRKPERVDGLDRVGPSSKIERGRFEGERAGGDHQRTIQITAEPRGGRDAVHRVGLGFDARRGRRARARAADKRD
jgi:hypothetical protein